VSERRTRGSEELPALLRGPISDDTRHRLQHLGAELQKLQAEMDSIAQTGELDPRLCHGVRIMWNLLRWDVLQLSDRRRWAWPEGD
jgi:hypothetical protein